MSSFTTGSVYRVNSPGHEWDGRLVTLEWRRGLKAWVMRDQECRKVELLQLTDTNIASTAPSSTSNELRWQDDERLVLHGRVRPLRTWARWVLATVGVLR